MSLRVASSLLTISSPISNLANCEVIVNKANLHIEYKNTGIPEYWIVDPIEQKITVLVLKDGSYTKAVFTEDNAICSATFSQLKLTPDSILEA